MIDDPQQDDKQKQAAQRLAAVLERVTARANDEFGLSLGAIASGLIGAGVRAAQADMPTDQAVASWLRDIAGGLERGANTDDLPEPTVH